MQSLPQKIISFFLRHPEFAKALLCRNYAFTEPELFKYQNILDWNWISGNNSIRWTAELVDRYKDKLDWEFFSANSAAFANIELLDQFVNYIDWKGINSGKFFSFSVGVNENIPWTVELIKTYADRLNFEHLSNNEKLPWSEQLIDQFDDRWDWEGVASNPGVPWTLSLVKKHFEKIDFSSNWVNSNLSFTDQIDLIEEFSDQLNWRIICSNPKLPWKEENLLKRWEKRLNWYGLATNEILHKDQSFFESNLEKWLADPFNYFGLLSRNSALHWSAELIERFSDFWDWDWLCMNKGISWDTKMIDRFIDKVEWGGREYFPDNSFRVKGGLISNENLDWSIDFILRYEEYIDFEELFIEVAWSNALKPCVGEKFIDVICKLI